VSSEDIPSRVAVVAAAHEGTLDARYRVQPSAILEAHVAGPLVRSARHLLASTRIPLITQWCEASNPGTYGAVDVSRVTGAITITADIAVVPRDEIEGYWLVVTGGEVGDGSTITYYESTNAGRSMSGLKKLGSATSLTFASDGVKLDLGPSQTVAVAYLNDMVTKFQAHAVFTTDSVHGDADPAAPYTIGTASDWASAYTVFGQLRTSALAHVATVGTTHGAADGPATTAITAIAVPATPTALIAALTAFKAAFFGTPPTVDSGHTQRTQGTVHAAQDSVNVLTAPAATRGTLNAGDVIRVNTTAPAPSEEELAAAFSSLALSDLTPGIVLIPGRTPASYAGTITAGLDLLKANGKPCECIVQARRATVSPAESQAELREALEEEWTSTDKRILVAATDALCTYQEGTVKLTVARERFSGFATHFAARRVRNPFYETTWKVQPAFEGVRLVDSDGVLVGHDEPSDVPTRLQLLYRVPDSQQGRPTVPSIDYSLAGEEDREKTQRANLIRDEIERVFNSWAWSQVGTLAATRAGLAAGVADIDAPDLVTVDPNVGLNGDIVFIAAVINWTPIGAIGRISSTISARVGT
jgi:hypothetical protein